MFTLPKPVKEGYEIPPMVIQWLNEHGFHESVRLVEARDAFGRGKYGQCLMSQDGRDSVEDARQELGDALQYIYKAIFNGEDITPLKPHIEALSTLIKSMPDRNT